MNRPAPSTVESAYKAHTASCRQCVAIAKLNSPPRAARCAAERALWSAWSRSLDLAVTIEHQRSLR